MSITAVNPTLVDLVDRLVASRVAGGAGKPGTYPSVGPKAVAAAFPTGELAQQLIELTGGTSAYPVGNTGQVRAVRLQYEYACCLARAEALRRSTRIRVQAFAAARRAACGKGLRLPLEAAQTLLRMST